GNTVDQWQAIARDHAKSDRIGHAISRSFDLMGAIMRDGVGSQSANDLNELLAQDRVFVMARDKNANDPLRKLFYGMIESLGLMISNITERRAEEFNSERIQKLDDIRNEYNGEPPSPLPLFDNFMPKEEPGMFDPPLGTLGDEDPADFRDDFLQMMPGSSHPERIDVLVKMGGDEDESEMYDDEELEYWGNEWDDKPGTSTQTDGKRRINAPQLFADEVSGHICRYCRREFDSNTGLMKHIQYAHSKGSKPPKAKKMGNWVHPYKCPHCPSVLASVYMIVRHLRNVHKIHPFDCSTCGKKFYKKSLHVKHKRETGHP
ncbi:hypothetical protein PENTCL1PPCAC_25925, partial [Pristionchus entomophagus]